MRLAEQDFVDLYLSKEGDTGWFKCQDGSLKTVPAGCAVDMAAMAQACNELEEKGLVEYPVKHDAVRYRAAQFDSEMGEFRVLRKQPLVLRQLDNLGLHPGIIRLAMEEGIRGLMLVCGKTGSGKTTTASAIVAARLKKYGGVAITVEDPPEMPLSGKHGEGVCFQTYARPSTGGFTGALRRTVRMAPDIVMLGELRDNDTATEALRACVNGHLVIATTHAGSPIEAIERIIAMTSDINREGARTLLADGLHMVLCQDIDEDGRLSVIPLYLGPAASAARNRVRKGEVNQLSSDIQTLQNLLARGALPPSRPSESA